MVTRITNGKVLVDGHFIEADVYIDGKTIRGIGGNHGYDCQIDAGGHYVTAGFIDIHCHGGCGFSFGDADAEGARQAALMHLRHGTTTLFPTVSSSDFQALEQALRAIEQAQETTPSLGGIHLEGPYFSPAQTGAQNSDALRLPKAEEYAAILANHKIARWDYAPELDTDLSFLNALLAAKVLPSAAHTDATCQQMERAADHGCKLITHLYSCTSTIHREFGFRIAGVVEAAYLRDDICAELIADGCHLPYELIRLAYKQKGADRLILVTDAIQAAGLEDCQYYYEPTGEKRLIEDGVAKLEDRSAFAGSIATADRLLRTCVAAGIPLAEAVKMLTQTPAGIMGLSHKGHLKPGFDADIVIFDDNIHIKTVILQGNVIS